MAATALTEREKIILNCIVESYVKTATPVGSRFLAKAFRLGISPATIRNVMNDLEEMGYLSQPHISAGRVPTDKGYRFYVDSLISFQVLAKRERDVILCNLGKVSRDVTEILEASSRVLGEISNQLGVVLEPRFYQGTFQKIELVPISDRKILAVISIQAGLVKTIMIEIESGVSRELLEETTWVINERLSGLSLKEVKETIDKRLNDISISDDRLVRLILQSSERLFNFEGQKDLHFAGAINIVSTPEFSDRSYATKILNFIESKQDIVRLFDDAKADKISITIGRENKEDLLSSCSIITTRYYMGNITGMLGVVGPMRMHYSRIISLVDYMGGVLTQMLGEKMN